MEIRHNLKSSFSGTAQWGSGVQPSHVQEDGEEEAGQEGEVQDAACHIHGDQGGDGDRDDDWGDAQMDKYAPLLLWRSM